MNCLRNVDEYRLTLEFFGNDVMSHIGNDETLHMAVNYN